MEKWYENIKDPDQLKRLASAKKAECTPVSIDKENCTGCFRGKSGSYQTTMEECSCVDYARRHLPCKHMLRLAIELGFLNEEAKADKSKIYDNRINDGLSLEEIVNLLEQTSEKTQLIYKKEFLLEYLFRKKGSVKMECNSEFADLINLGLLEIVRDDSVLLMQLKGYEIKDRLKAANIIPAKLPRANKDLVEWCIENVDDIPSVFSDFALVTVPVNLQKNIRKVYTYLRRKYDTEEYMDENGNFYSRPVGASTTVTIDLNGNVQTEETYIDDEITALLNKYNCNPCKRAAISAIK